MPHPPKGDARPEIFRFPLGAFEITTVLDGAVQMAVSPPFLLDESDEEIAAIAAASHLPADRLENNFVPAVINTGDTLVLVDTGFGAPGRERGAGHLRARLAASGIAPEQVDAVMITHVHPDHIGGLLEDGAPAFPNAELLIGRREFDAWKDGTAIPEQRAQNREMFLSVVAPLEERFRFLGDGDEITPGVVAEAAFGHSPGHMMVRVQSGGAHALIWGDVANHYVFSVAHPDSKVGFDDDKPQSIATRNRVLGMAAETGVLIVGYHMPFPGVGHVERRADGGFRWLPITYQPFL